MFILVPIIPLIIVLGFIFIVSTLWAVMSSAPAKFMQQLILLAFTGTIFGLLCVYGGYWLIGENLGLVVGGAVCGLVLGSMVGEIITKGQTNKLRPFLTCAAIGIISGILIGLVIYQALETPLMTTIIMALYAGSVYTISLTIGNKMQSGKRNMK